MKKFFLVAFLLVIKIGAFAQTSIDVEIDGLLTLEQYQTIIDNYANKDVETYSARSIYYIGFSYYMLEDDDNCLKYMDLTIEKDPTNPAAYFIKASTYNYMNRFDDAIPCFQKAISLETKKENISKSYISLGYSHYNLNQDDLAIDAYNKAIEYDSAGGTPYIMIAQIYSKQNRDDKALELYYKGRENASKENENYITILFNIGLFEQKAGNYNKAETAYKELLEIDFTDYHTYAKLIQVYNQTKEYDKISPLKDVLYSAHKQGLIQDECLSDMFCIDQFERKGKQIRVFEKYQEGKSETIYNKLIFYVFNNDEKMEYSIQTEYSPAAVAFGEGKYILCANKDDSHINYGLIFDDDSTYEEIKTSVLNILDKEE